MDDEGIGPGLAFPILQHEAPDNASQPAAQLPTFAHTDFHALQKVHVAGAVDGGRHDLGALLTPGSDKAADQELTVLLSCQSGQAVAGDFNVTRGLTFPSVSSANPLSPFTKA